MITNPNILFNNITLLSVLSFIILGFALGFRAEKKKYKETYYAPLMTLLYGGSSVFWAWLLQENKSFIEALSNVVVTNIATAVVVFCMTRWPEWKIQKEKNDREYEEEKQAKRRKKEALKNPPKEIIEMPDDSVPPFTIQTIPIKPIIRKKKRGNKYLNEL